MPRCTTLLVFLALAWLSLHRPPAQSGHGPKTDANPSIDVLLGKNQRQAFADGLAKKEYGGRTHAWDQYVAWGRSLAIDGRAKEPPVGPAPSMPLADTYRCVHCHNLLREDAKLIAQDPERREKLIRTVNLAQLIAQPVGQAAQVAHVAPRRPRRPVAQVAQGSRSGEPSRTAAQQAGLQKRDGSALSLTPGTTLWAAVNRESFYNGHYQRYHALKVCDFTARRPGRRSGEPSRTGDERKMNPQSLSDAIQVCCSYCSAGRFPEPWELDSLLAFLWTLELRLKDLGLPDKDAQALLEQLTGQDEVALTQARQTLRQHYLPKAVAERNEEPLRTKDNVDSYDDGTNYTGDARRGKLVYRSACAGCHGGNVHAKAEADLVSSDKLFHRYVWKGTQREGVYMPLFTQQRLSRQQAADIRAYLHSLR